jgi:O-antigen/teichoic acid export membrane protein
LSFGYINQAVLSLVGLWLTPFLLYRIGQHDYGLWLVGVQLLSYLTLMDLGVVALLPRSTAYATGRAINGGSTSELPTVIGHTIRLIFWQMPLVITGAALFWLLLPAEWQGLRQPLALVMITFVLTFPLRIFQAVLNGLQDLAFLGKGVLFGVVLSNLVTLGLAIAGWGIYALALGWFVTQVIQPLIFWYRLSKRFPHTLPTTLPKLSWPIARGILTSGCWISVAQFAQALMVGTDVLIIGKLLGPVAVVPYVCTGKLLAVLANQPQMIMQAAFPGLSQMRTSESPQRLFQVCATLSQAMLLVSGAVVCVVLVVNRGFVTWWVGKNQYGGLWLTGLLVAGMLLRHWNTAWIYPLLCLGKERRISVTNLLDGLTTAVTAVMLVWWMGANGAAIAAIIAVCLVSLPGNIHAMSVALNISVMHLIKGFWPWLWRFTIVAALSVYAARIWAPNSFILLALTTTLTFTVYCAIMLPILLRPGLGDYVRPQLSVLRMKLRTLSGTA